MSIIDKLTGGKDSDKNGDKNSDEQENAALTGTSRQAVENQAVVTPDDYPDSDGGKPDYRRQD